MRSRPQSRLQLLGKPGAQFARISCECATCAGSMHHALGQPVVIFIPQKRAMEVLRSRVTQGLNQHNLPAVLHNKSAHARLR